MIANVVFSASLGKKIVYAPWEQMKNASDRMFVTLAFGLGDNLHAIRDIRYFYSCVIYYFFRDHVNKIAA